MEFSLLKQIVPNRFYLPSSFSTHPSHQPGFNYINPGIGNVVQPFSFFVPTFFQSNPNLKSKRIPDEAPVTPHIELEGKGNEIEETKPENVEKVDNESDADQNILDELNSKKRKLLDASIYESFTHPKKIKTESLILKSANSAKSSQGVSSTKINKGPKEIKHKFKFE